MPKRRHDSEIWKEDWFANLSKDYKLAFLLVKDLCDFIGVWRPNQGDFKNVIGKEIRYQSFLDKVNSDKLRIFVLPNGRWYLVDFIEFQYGRKLNKKLNVHVNVAEFVNRAQIPFYLFDKELLSFMEDVGKQLGYAPLSRPLSRPLSHGYYTKLSTEDTKEVLSADITEEYNSISIEADEKKSDTLPMPEKIRIEDKIVLDEKPPNLPPPAEPNKPARKSARVVVEPDLKHPWDTDTFREAWEYWKDYKYRVHRFQYKDNRSENSMMEHLEELANGHEDYAIKIIKYTEGRQWQGFQRPDNLPVPARKPTGLFAEIPASNGEATLFKDSPDFDKTRFTAAFQGTEYEGYNAAYYHEALLNWSDSKGAKVLDWIAQARSFMMRDAAASRAVLNEGVTLKSNLNGQHKQSGSGVRSRPDDPENIAAMLGQIDAMFANQPKR